MANSCVYGVSLLNLFDFWKNICFGHFKYHGGQNRVRHGRMSRKVQELYFVRTQKCLSQAPFVRA